LDQELLNHWDYFTDQEKTLLSSLGVGGENKEKEKI